jgi:phosphoglycolate phosphatase
MTPAFIFDLDGTLVDTAPDINIAINKLVSREGRREIALDEMRFLVGNGVKKLVERAFKRTGDAADPDNLDKLTADFLAHYCALKDEHSRIYPGVVETLEKLMNEGARLAVLTNKPQKSAEQLIAAKDLGRFFKVVFGGGKRDYLKPDPRLYADVLAELGGSGPSVMVGDSLPDMETARNAGVPGILVSYGYSATAPDSLDADALVDRFAEVPEAARRLLEG